MKHFHPKRYLRMLKPANLYMAIRKVWYRHLSTCKHVEGTWILSRLDLWTAKDVLLVIMHKWGIILPVGSTIPHFIWRLVMKMR